MIYPKQARVKISHDVTDVGPEGAITLNVKVGGHTAAHLYPGGSVTVNVPRGVAFTITESSVVAGRKEDGSVYMHDTYIMENGELGSHTKNNQKLKENIAAMKNKTLDAVPILIEFVKACTDSPNTTLRNEARKALANWDKHR